MTKKELIIFSGYYLPGYKAGGVLKAVSNFVINLKDKMNLRVVTRDRDLGSDAQYSNIETDKWTNVNGVPVFYLSKNIFNFFHISFFFNSYKKTEFFFNSFFEHFTVFYFINYFFWLRFFEEKKIFLAPHGEFSDAAFNIRKTKKKIYLFVFKLIYNPDFVHWIFTDKSELDDLNNKLSIQINNYSIIKDLPEISSFKHVEFNIDKTSNNLNVVFISRISPVKNLDLALKIINKINIPIKFDIYGPIGDLNYWKRCKSIIKSMNSNCVEYKGSLEPNEVPTIFSKYHLYLNPTGGENYGYTIVESLLQGTPILLSDKTPWNDLEQNGWGWNVPLEDIEGFKDKIENNYKNIILIDKSMRIKIRKSFIRKLNLDKLINNYLNIFTK